MRTPPEAESFADPSFSKLGLKLEQVVEESLPGGDEVRAFPVFRKIAETPRPFPRKWAEMKGRPLADLTLKAKQTR